MRFGQENRAMSEDYSHKDAIAALSAEELTALKRLADLPGLFHLAGHVALLVITGCLVLLTPNWPMWIAAMLLHGIILIFLFTLEHEAIHGTAFRTAWINSVVSEFAGFLLLLPPRSFRFFHFAHHRFTQDLALDPELSSPRPKGWRQYLWLLTGLNYWKYAVTGLINGALGRNFGSFVPSGGRAKVINEARAHLLAIAILALLALYFGWTWPLELWVIPALLGQPFLRVFLLAEHAGCPMVSDMLQNSRTTYANRLVRFLTWNMPNHAAHHALPVVPFHRLPALTAKLEPRLKSVARGYAEAHRQIRANW